LLEKKDISCHEKSIIESELTKKNQSLICNKEMLRYFKEIVTPRVTQYKNTDEDKMFVSNFITMYRKLMESIEHNGGISLTFSFAVFIDRSAMSRIYSNYKLIPSILTIFENQPNNILAEWCYREGCYCVYRSVTNKLICFIKPTSEINGLHLVYQKDGSFKFNNAETHFQKKTIVRQQSKPASTKYTELKSFCNKTKIIHLNKIDNLEDYKFNIYSAICKILQKNISHCDILQDIFSPNIELNEFIMILSDIFKIKIYLNNPQKIIQVESTEEYIYIIQRDDEGIDIIMY